MPAVNIDSSPLPWMIASINQLVRLEAQAASHQAIISILLATHKMHLLLRGNDAICRKFHHLSRINVSQLPFFPFLPVCEHSVAILGIYIGIQEQFLPPLPSVEQKKCR